jgi:hypothetical protein
LQSFREPPEESYEAIYTQQAKNNRTMRAITHIYSWETLKTKSSVEYLNIRHART